MRDLNYVNLEYEPTEDDMICEYYVEPKGCSLEEASQNIALESSIGTWTTISTMNPDIARTLKPSVFYINKKTGIIKIAYPSRLFEKGNMPSILSSIAGNIFGMAILNNLRLEDIHFPKDLAKSFKGPRYGIEGIRKLTKIRERPLLGTIVKPKVGLNEKQHAEVAYQAWLGGLDIVKDDENLVSMEFNNFKKRVELTLAAKRKAEKITGEKKIYLPNITAETFEMLKRAEIVRKNKGEYVMVDVVTIGFSGLQTIRDRVPLFLHAHRAMHGAITRNKKHGISMLVLAKLCRLIGTDQLHIGTAHVGKMQGSVAEIIDIEEEIEDRMISEDNPGHVLEQPWYGIKPMMAVASGGLHPGGIPKVIERMGKNIIIQLGGGVHGHPDGTLAGATAARQALEATMNGIPLKEYAKEHRELRKAIDKWGIVK